MNFYRVDSKDLLAERGQVIYLHDGKDIGSGAFDLNESSLFRILLPRSAGVVSVLAEIYNESGKDLLQVCYGTPSDFNFTTDTFLIEVDVKSLGVGLFIRLFVIAE